MELDVGELRDAIDGEEHHEPAIGVTQLAAVDVNAVDFVGLEAFALLGRLLDRQPGDAVALEAAVQGAAAEMGDALL